jgi:hypothetical protein
MDIPIIFRDLQQLAVKLSSNVGVVYCLSQVDIPLHPTNVSVHVIVVSRVLGDCVYEISNCFETISVGGE